MTYRKIFDPKLIDRSFKPAPGVELSDDDIYVFSDPSAPNDSTNEIILAVNVAIVTHRPLLLYGPPGSGKSSLASNVARILDVPIYTETITSRTEIQDLLWRLDAVRRLSDATSNREVKEESHYINPGVLWKAFKTLPSENNVSDKPASVVLLDEIDKADPDVPDGLLGPLGSMSFNGPDDVEVRPMGNPPLIIITTNNERQLSRPFLRRCVTLTLHPPTREHLLRVAKARFGHSNTHLYEKVADFVVSLIAKSGSAGRGSPSTAEYIDAIRSCRELKITTDDPVWSVLSRVVLAKADGSE